MGVLHALSSRLRARIDPFLHPDLHPLFRESPFVIYDIGAAGDVCIPFRGPICDRMRIYGFEPTEEGFRALVRKHRDEPSVEIRQVALCDRDEAVPFHICTGGRITYSSLIDLSARGLDYETTTVEGARLDSVPARYGFPPADFLKLDTEGSELQILTAGRQMLETEVLGVMVEISFWRKGTAGVVFHEIDRLMNDLGFVLYDLRINRSHISGLGGKKDKVRSGDALYLRDFSDYAAGAGADLSGDRVRIKLFKLIALCIAWRYLEYAVELLDYGRRQGVVTAAEFRSLARDWSSVVDIASRIPNFPGRLRVARLFDALSYALHTNAKKGIPQPFDTIGNPWRLTVRGRRQDRIRIKDPIFQEDGNAGIKIIDLDDAAQ